MLPSQVALRNLIIQAHKGLCVAAHELGGTLSQLLGMVPCPRDQEIRTITRVRESTEREGCLSTRNTASRSDTRSNGSGAQQITCAHLAAGKVDHKGRVPDLGRIQVLVPAIDAEAVLKVHLQSTPQLQLR